MLKLVSIKKIFLQMTHNFQFRPNRISASLFSMGTAILALSGCTTTMVTKKLDTSATPPVAGQIYSLPRVDYLVSLDRELTACSIAYESEEEKQVLLWLHEATNTVKNSKNAKEILAENILSNEEIKEYLENPAVLGVNWDKNWINDLDNGVSDTRLSKKLNSITPGITPLKLNFNVLMRASVTPLVSQDPEHTYVIDYQKMQNLLKGTEYKVETYPNGTLKSVNVHINDHTGEAIDSVVKGAAKLAAASGGVPLSIAEGADDKIQSFAEWKRQFSAPDLSILQVCNISTQLKLAKRNALVTQAENKETETLNWAKKTNSLENNLAMEIIERDKKQAIFDQTPENDGNKDKARAALVEAENAVKVARGELSAAKQMQRTALEESGSVAARLLAIRKELTLTKVTTITPEPGDTLVYDLKGLDEARGAWLIDNSESEKDFCKKNPTECIGGGNGKIGKAMEAQAVIYPKNDHTNKDLTKKIKDLTNRINASKTDKERAEAEVELKLAKDELSRLSTSDGVLYRQPVRSTLFVCKETCLDKDGKPAVSEDANNLLLSTVIDNPQLGTLATLPLKNGPFQNNLIEASFSENGALTSLTYETNATAAKAAERFDASSDTVLQYTQAKHNQEATKLGQSKSEINARKDLLDAQLLLLQKQDEYDKYLAERNKSAQ